MEAKALSTRTPPQAPRGDAPTGSAPPASGKDLQAGGKAPPPPEPIDIQQAVRQIQSYLEGSRRSLQFRIDDNAGRPVMTVLNPDTGEVIRQIPPEEVVEIAATLDRSGIRLIDQLA